MIGSLMVTLLFLSQIGTAQKSVALLSEEAVWMIVMNTPDAVQLEGRHGCPNVELIREAKFLISVQLRNGCPNSGSGLIDNYTVDLRTGQIWTGIDDKKYIDSDRLRRLRVLLGKKQARLPQVNLHGSLAESKYFFESFLTARPGAETSTTAAAIRYRTLLVRNQIKRFGSVRPRLARTINRTESEDPGIFARVLI